MFDSLMKAYSDEIPLMTELGLRIFGYTRDWLDIGTVQLHEPDEYHPNPTLIKVEVSAMPAKFWRFTITKDSDTIEPTLEKIVVSTGSGLFTTYWPSIKLIADNMLVIE